MKLALIALPSEIGMYARCISDLEDTVWVGFGGYPGFGTHFRPGDQGMGRQAAVPAYFSSEESLMDSADAVLVAGRIEDRFRFISKALRKGKPVWTLGPMTNSWEESSKLASLAEEARVCNQAAHLPRESPVLQAALPYAQDFRLLRVDIAFPWASSPLFFWEQDLLFAAFDRIWALAASPLRKIKAKSVPCFGEADSECMLDLEFSSGMEAQVWLSRTTAQRKSLFQGISEKHWVRLDFLRHELVVKEGKTLVSQGKEERRYEETCLDVAPDRPLFDNLKRFVEACMKGKSSHFSFSRSCEVQEGFSRVRSSLGSI